MKEYLLIIVIFSFISILTFLENNLVMAFFSAVIGLAICSFEFPWNKNK